MVRKYAPALFILFFLSTISTLAQHSVEGKVIDQSNTPVAFANVILLNAEDSTTVYKGAVTSENGGFSFDAIEEADYLLKISFVGYEDLLKQIKVDSDEDLGEIILKESTDNLDEVTITMQYPTVTREVDRLVFYVANSTLSSGNSWDILRKTPGVILANENLQVRNQPVEVYINDRKVQLSSAELKTLLENYSAENITSVEVITNPPARYDAEGGAILNIITSKSISPGYKGSVNASWTQAIYPKYSFGTSHYLKSEKLNLFANYSYNPRKEFKKDDSYINFINNGGIFSRWITDFDRTTRSQAHNASLILDYSLDDKNILSFSTNAVVSPDESFDNNVVTRIIEENDLKYFTTESTLNEDQSNVGMELKYKHLLEKPGAEISILGQFTTYDQDREQQVFTDYSDGVDNSFATFAQQDINIYVGQLDYVTPLGSTNFEAGLKASAINSESGINYFDTETGSVINSALSDNFLYDENIFAGYASISKDWESWSVKGGLRGEFTSREGDSRSMKQVDSREYFELFPTFYLQRTLSENHSLTFDYSRRIQRPRYESLNPFRYFLNEHNYNAGNPNLRAAISNNFNLNYTLKGQYFFDLYYRDNGPYSRVLGFQDNDNLTIRNVSVNLLESLSYGFDISHARPLTDYWYASAYVSLFHDEQTFLALESNNAAVTNEVNGVYGTMNNSLTLSKDGTFTGDLIFTYVSGWISGSYDLEPMTTLSFGFRKTIWNNRAELSLHFEDVLDQTNTRLTSQYLNQDNSFFAQPESMYVRLGFKYNFGNFRLSDNQRSIEAAERERL